MQKKIVTIETERLILRPFTLDDIPAAHGMNLDERVNEYTGDGGVVSLEETTRRIQEDVLGDYAKYGYGRLAVILKSENKFIGFAGLKYLDDMNEVDLGYRFLSAHWGKGIATEAAIACLNYGFNTLQLKRIIAMLLPNNIGSIRVLEKTGFHYEKEFMEDGELIKQYCIENS